jgi:hypothetical protein
VIYGCLTPIVLAIVMLCLGIRGDYAWVIGFLIVSIVIHSAIVRLIERRHCRAIVEEGARLGITNMRIEDDPALIDPEELPWYVGWSCYDVEADDPAGLRRRYSAFLTWTWFGFSGVTVSFSTDQDYDCYDENGQRIDPSSLIGEPEQGAR